MEGQCKQDVTSTVRSQIDLNRHKQFIIISGFLLQFMQGQVAQFTFESYIIMTLPNYYYINIS